MNRRPTGRSQARHPLAKHLACYLCIHSLGDIDFKETVILQRFTSSYGKVVPRRKSGMCAWHQRKLAQAIKRARFMALLPYVRG